MNAKQKKLDKAVRLVAANSYLGLVGYDWTYAAFDWINKTLFDSRLPTPLITWQQTAHGKCIGQTASRDRAVPRIVLHPATMGIGIEADKDTDKRREWLWDESLKVEYLGPRFALDVLIHECMHVSVSLMNDCHGPTSHNNDCWVSEVNRIAPLLGFDDVQAGRSKSTRVKVAGKRGKRGALPTKVERHTEGNIPWGAVSGFPNHILRKRRYYLGRAVPFEVPV